LKSSIPFFVLVGCTAALVHLTVVYALVGGLGWPALWANPLGFLTAFGVSFWGHARLTFGLPPDGHARAARRFFVLAATGFALNQAAYAWGRDWVGAQAYLPLLVAVMALVAGVTYLLGKFWAFADARVS
jgi:putative flippase GtrA